MTDVNEYDPVFYTVWFLWKRERKCCQWYRCGQGWCKASLRFFIPTLNITDKVISDKATLVSVLYSNTEFMRDVTELLRDSLDITDKVIQVPFPGTLVSQVPWFPGTLVSQLP